ncbi:hypothetical protein AWENTII_004444 [Aspergillus wentii]
MNRASLLDDLVHRSGNARFLRDIGREDKELVGGNDQRGHASTPPASLIAMEYLDSRCARAVDETAFRDS